MEMKEAIYCSGPKYQYPYSGDQLHLSTLGYDLLGEKYAEVYNEVVVKKNVHWAPVQPTGISTISPNVIRVDFNVPNPPLVWDEELPSPHQDKPYWAKGKGFEVTYDQNITYEISQVEIGDTGDYVLIVLADYLPLVGNVTVGYAATSTPAREWGTVRWGLLKDSDDVVGYTTHQAQPNWAVAFEMNLVL